MIWAKRPYKNLLLLLGLGCLYLVPFSASQAQDNGEEPAAGPQTLKRPAILPNGPGAVGLQPRVPRAGLEISDDDPASASGGGGGGGGGESGTSKAKSAKAAKGATEESDPEDDGSKDMKTERNKPPVINPNAKVTIDFVDTEITDLVKYFAEISGRNFILGDKLSGKVTIISHKPVSVAEAYEAFLSALEVAGYTTVTVGKTTKVVKTSDAGKSPLRIYEGSDIPTTDNYITQIFQFDNISVSDISTVVKELASANARVIAYQPTNTLIMTDSATSIRRVYRIISELDVAAPKSRLEIIPLKYATASDLQGIIEELYGVEGASSSSTPEPTAAARRRRGRAGAAAPEPAAAAQTSTTTVGEGTYISKIIADERTNSLIIRANTEAMSNIIELISKLDVDVDPASRAQIHVIYLEHAKAVDLAQVLTSLASGGGSYGGSSGAATRRTTTGGGVSTPSRSSGGQSAGSRLGRPDMGGAAGQGTRTGAAGGQAGTASIFESGLRVTSDENTNSLVVVAGPEEFAVLKKVVDKLDIRRKQVFVESVILEMASDETFDWGIGYHVGSPNDDGGLTAVSSQLNGSSFGLSSQDLLSGLAVGIFGQNIEVGTTDSSTGAATTLSVPAFGIALNALQSNSAVNILSTPNVLTTDNEEAKIIVGRNIPFPISTGRDSNNNPIVSYQREDVAITLKVTPQINESNYVTLEVFQEVQEIEEDSQGLDVSSAGFITSKRSAETTVVVQDNQTVVIGGLIGNTDTEVETKIPILGDLPLVGVLFRGTRIKSRKSNLLIFLTPHVISEPEDLEEIYRIKVAQRNEFLSRFYGKSREQQEKAMKQLLQFSMNLVDEPSVYRTKKASAPNVTTIETQTSGPVLGTKPIVLEQSGGAEKAPAPTEPLTPTTETPSTETPKEQPPSAETPKEP